MLLSERSIYKMHVLILVIRASLLVLGYSKFFRHFLYWPWLLLLMAWRHLAGHVGQARESDHFVGTHISLSTYMSWTLEIFLTTNFTQNYNTCTTYVCIHVTLFFFFFFFFSSLDSSYLTQDLPSGTYDSAIDIDQQTDSNHETALTLAAAGERGRVAHSHTHTHTHTSTCTCTHTHSHTCTHSHT